MKTKTKSLAEMVDRQRKGTDSVSIRSNLLSHDNPAFAWAVVQTVCGESVDGVYETLPVESRRFLTTLKRKPLEERSETVEAFKEKLPEQDREAFNGLLASFPPGSPNPLKVLDMEDVMKTVEGVKWLWKGWVAYAMCSEIFGEPGEGKSALTLGGIIRAVTTACNWPDGKHGLKTPQNVLWCDTEGKMGETVHRLKKWKLPPKRILIPFEDIHQPISLSNPEHLKRVEFLVAAKQIHLVIVDALRTAHGHEENSSKIANVLQPVAQIAERTNAAFLFVHHSRKLGMDEEITANASRGSNAIHAMMRTAIGIDKPDPQSDWRRARVVKENLGHKPPPLGFRITNEGLEFGKAPERPRRQSETDRAVEFLRERLKDGKPHEASEIKAEGAEHGFAERTLNLALTDKLGIKPRKSGKKWIWQMKMQRPS